MVVSKQISLVFVNKVLLEPHILIHILLMTAFMLQWQSLAVATEMVEPAKPKILTIWFFTEKVCQYLIYVT